MNNCHKLTFLFLLWELLSDKVQDKQIHPDQASPWSSGLPGPEWQQRWRHQCLYELQGDFQLETLGVAAVNWKVKIGVKQSSPSCNQICLTLTFFTSMVILMKWVQVQLNNYIYQPSNYDAISPSCTAVTWFMQCSYPDEIILKTFVYNITSSWVYKPHQQDETYLQHFDSVRMMICGFSIVVLLKLL